MKLLLCLLAVLLCGCDSQTRSSYQVEGTVDGKPAVFEIRGVENTATSTPNVSAIVSATTAALRGDLASLGSQLGRLTNAPAAEPPYAAGGAALTAIITALGLAYAQHKSKQNALSLAASYKADSDEGWEKLQAAQAEALKLAKALPPDRVPA